MKEKEIKKKENCVLLKESYIIPGIKIEKCWSKMEIYYVGTFF